MVFEANYIIKYVLTFHFYCLCNLIHVLHRILGFVRNKTFLILHSTLLLRCNAHSARYLQAF